MAGKNVAPKVTAEWGDESKEVEEKAKAAIETIEQKFERLLQHLENHGIRLPDLP